MANSRAGQFLKLIVLAAAASFIAFALWHATTPAPVQGTANPLPLLIACPNLDASADNKVTVADILSVVSHYGKSYGQSGYEYLWDSVTPYNSTSPAGTGSITVADILYVVARYNSTCPLLDTQIATATRAIADPTFSSILCDPAYANAKNCGGDPQLLTENANFLASYGYYPDGPDVPGQGIRYSKVGDGSGFNAARPAALIYKNGKLVAQSYFVDGSVPGWGDSPTLGTMGYLWNWLPNANLVPDSPAPNGRFADCFPDVGGWGAYSCPEVLPQSLQWASGTTSLDGLKQLIEGDGGLAPLISAAAAAAGLGGGAAGVGAGPITAGQVFGNFRVVCVYPNGGLAVVPVGQKESDAPRC
jgi:hypothetical protein